MSEATTGAALPGTGSAGGRGLSAGARPADRLRAAPRVLADAVAGTPAREAALLVAATALLAVAARIAIPLPFTPVPLSLATLAVLVSGAALGPRRAVAATGLYALLGVAGVPVFAGGQTGWAFASFGYVLGYAAASVLVGWLAARGADRRMWSAALMGVAGSAMVYATGLVWMVPWLGLSLGEGLAAGVLPFLLGDALKIAVVAALMPAAWGWRGRRG